MEPSSASDSDAESTFTGVIGPLLSAFALLVGGLAASALTTGLVSVVCALVGLAAGAYLLFLGGPLLVFLVLNRSIENLGRTRPETLRDRMPWYVWAFTGLLVTCWALGAWLAGYDVAEWTWTGISVGVASVAILAAHFRRRRASVPDGPDGPRHRQPLKG